ncbi:MAG: DUF374 domain-containing protein [Deltaproteobacteria bacterium]|nr:DUF374 domain-containing protein [Deltaproteobacteria bacterium]
MRFSGETPTCSLNQRSIYSFWHEDLFLLACWALQSRQNFKDYAILISSHRDANLALVVLNKLNIQTIRGSSRRGFVHATRALLTLDKHIINISDGPRGPARRLKRGIIRIAEKTGRNICHFEFHCHSLVKLPSWDRLKIPVPFTVVEVFRVGLNDLATV